MDFGSFKDWLAPGLAKELEEANWALADDTDPHISHQYRVSVMITNPDFDADNRERVVQHYLTFFQEIVEKLQLQAVELMPSVVMDEELTTNVLDMLRMFLHKVMSGDSLYAPYLSITDPKTEDNFNQGVDVALYLGITKPTQELPIGIFWFINTEFWKRNPENPSFASRVSSIENSLDYDKS